jgi:sulfur carrier protein
VKLIVNEKESIFEKSELTIDELLQRLGIDKNGIAVVVNGDIIRKVRFAEYKLKDGDRVDIITMVGGG